jgi:antitoxin ParD1/3/4
MMSMDATSLHLTLSEDLRAFIDIQVAEGGYGTPDEYVRELLISEKRRKAREHLDRLLLAGVDSGAPTPMTEEDWTALRGRLESEFGGQPTE